MQIEWNKSNNFCDNGEIFLNLQRLSENTKIYYKSKSW